MKARRVVCNAVDRDYRDRLDNVRENVISVVAATHSHVRLSLYAGRELYFTRKEIFTRAVRSSERKKRHPHTEWVINEPTVISTLAVLN